MDLNDVALEINALKGMGVIRLGFRLNKKPDKTPEETAAAKAFLKTFRGTLGIIILFIVILFILTGYVFQAASGGYKGEYDQSRTGRIVNGQIRYVKNELYYISPSEIGLSDELPDGTHINLYFDEDGKVIAGENADELNKITEQRVILTISAMAAMAIILILFAIISRKTFGKAWVQWLEQFKNQINQAQT
ncbi:MAG TPA: hypothetical protein H9664_05745 [Firmicutes bacterium]|nr:hypothetical protein [Bacillota bacterium]